MFVINKGKGCYLYGVECQFFKIGNVAPNLNTKSGGVLEIGCGSGIIALGITPYAKHLVSERLT